MNHKLLMALICLLVGALLGFVLYENSYKINYMYEKVCQFEQAIKNIFGNATFSNESMNKYA